MSGDIKDKIRKLLTLGESSSFAGEANNAMDLAMRLMLEHGLTREDLEDPSMRVGIGEYEYKDASAWHEIASWAATTIFGTRVVCYKSRASDQKDLAFAGRGDNIAATIILFESIIQQVEALYKRLKPVGMTKTQRSMYRREFKRAAALRVYQRALDLVEQLRKEAMSSAVASTSTALALISHHDALVLEVDQFLHSDLGMKFGQTRVSEIKATRATIDGIAAGDQVKIQESLRGS